MPVENQALLIIKPTRLVSVWKMVVTGNWTPLWNKIDGQKFQAVLTCNAPLCLLDDMMEDMDIDLEKEFLHDLKELKVLVYDKDFLDQHKRYRRS